MSTDIDRASAAGFDGYIAKPIDIRNLPAQLAVYLTGGSDV